MARVVRLCISCQCHSLDYVTFTQVPHVRDEWVALLAGSDSYERDRMMDRLTNDPRRAYLCYRHFPTDSFVMSGGKYRLLDGAKPMPNVLPSSVDEDANENPLIETSASERTARIDRLRTVVTGMETRDPAAGAICALFSVIRRVTQQGLHSKLTSDLEFLEQHLQTYRSRDMNILRVRMSLRAAVYSMIEATKCMLEGLQERQNETNRITIDAHHAMNFGMEDDSSNNITAPSPFAALFASVEKSTDDHEDFRVGATVKIEALEELNLPDMGCWPATGEVIPKEEPIDDGYYPSGDSSSVKECDSTSSSNMANRRKRVVIPFGSSSLPFKHFTAGPSSSASPQLKRVRMLAKDNVGSSFNCEQCPKVYASQEFLNKHMLTHEGSSCSIQCVLCGMNFLTNDNLKTHLDEAHDAKTLTISQS